MFARALILGLMTGLLFSAAAQAEGPAEILIGQTNPYSGPLSAYGTQGRAQAAYYKMINDQGGVNGRKIKLISLDDAYSPPKTVEQHRRLIESDEVLGIVGTMGTPTNSAIVKYVNGKAVPHIFLATGASKWGDVANYPWTMGWYPTYRSEGMIYGTYIRETIKDAKIAILSQNDDYGRDFVSGFKAGLGDAADKLIVKELAYEVSEPTVDSEVITLKASGANVLFSAVTAKAAAQTIKKAAELDWHPTHFLVQNANSIATVLTPAGLDHSTGIISTAYLKDPSDPQFANDTGIKWYLDFMKQYYSDGDAKDPQNEIGVSIAATFVQVMRQCGDDLSRENLMKQANNIRDLELPLLLPGIKLNTSATDHYPIEQLQLVKFDGKGWQSFGPVLGSH
ncbi:ABC transporter substrate-binding protein [Bradyrhizobium erythrophlei]|jgi:ABC-type branched-subunit amino acid transport system substrate-binding protein|uniref:ABC-type branched-chain amino acid transport system, substrate-binding protein n=1 Tax=Bradyrhizobium erythrophlei TaxID=1437360 RepID=A0A1M7U8Q7_9BRAD|nr:ABC transporter substrate-binding protein [Bradyrhizobium erythrophlei]SHN79305.1 ABC-type branched-chain amino acid transport system, substrate-binding protein [Bradyrhizobium erythrophlei]